MKDEGDAAARGAADEAERKAQLGGTTIEGEVKRETTRS
jgi:hypothetical protein